MPIAVTCPFYLRDRDVRISCEACRAKLPDARTKRELMRDYCARDWRACPFAQALQKYYDRADGL